uniref:PUM-HD domain-containing protein n=1 Tax=Macrostomum lignano TaxID=282301 RepID=A0A1I8FQB3_9PLAT
MPLGRNRRHFVRQCRFESALDSAALVPNEGARCCAFRPGGRKRKLSEQARRRCYRWRPAKRASDLRAAASSSGSEDGDDDDAENGDEAAEDDEFENSKSERTHTIFEDLNESDKKKLKKPNKQQQQKQQKKSSLRQRKRRRALKKSRKKNADLVSELLTAWEDGRAVRICAQLGRGKLAELAAAHDTGRVLEARAQRGSDQQRWLIFERAQRSTVSPWPSPTLYGSRMRWLQNGGLVMQHLQQHLLALTQKDLIRHSLVQHLLLEYLEEAVPAGASGCQGNADASAVASLMENLRENLWVRHLSHKEDLKRALKSMKTFLCTSACNEHGYLFVLSLAERHSLTPEEAAQTCPASAARWLLYLLSPRDSLHFSPQLMSLILPPAAVGAGGEKSACYAALADLIRQPFVPCQNPTSQSSGDESDQQQQQQQHYRTVRKLSEDCSLRDRVATLLLGGGGGGFATALQSALKRQYRGAQLLSERIKAKTEPGSSLVGDRSAGDAESQQPVSKKARRLSKKL